MKPVITPEESARLDAAATDPVEVLMERAGLGVALAAVRMGARYGTRVLALAGPGNNGGDALVLLRNLAAWGRPVTAILIGERGGDEDLLHGWGIRTFVDSDYQGRASLLDGELARASVIVDGVLGTGGGGAAAAP